MNEKEMQKEAESLGFTKAAVILTEKLEFDASYRKYCKENLCGSYGNNYGCPPDCGTTEDMKKRISGFKKILVVQSIYQVKDIRNSAETKALKREHNDRSRKMTAWLKKQGVSCLSILAGPCSLCSECAKVVDKPCRFPEDITSCLSAYCIKAEQMAGECGMDYWCGENKAAFFSLFCF